MAIKQLVLFVFTFIATLANCHEEMLPMSIPIFVLPGDTLLQTNALEVGVDEISSLKTQAIIDYMFAIARGERSGTGEQGVMVGLAAPQIGICKRIILVDVGGEDAENGLGTLKAYINPEITWYSAQIEEDREGCYSVDSKVIGLVPRAQSIRIRALDRQGVLVTEELFGLTARIFQHEVDHLNGIRFPDRVGPEGNLHWVEDDEYVEYKKCSTTWRCKCPWSVWLAMKEGRLYSPPVKEESNTIRKK